MSAAGCYYWLDARPECRLELVAAGWRLPAALLYPAPTTTNMNQGQSGSPGWCPAQPYITRHRHILLLAPGHQAATRQSTESSSAPPPTARTYTANQPNPTSWWVEWSAGWLRVTGGHILVWSELCMSRTINTKNPGLRPDCLCRGQIRSKWADPTLAVYCIHHATDRRSPGPELPVNTQTVARLFKKTFVRQVVPVSTLRVKLNNQLNTYALDKAELGFCHRQIALQVKTGSGEDN